MADPLPRLDSTDRRPIVAVIGVMVVVAIVYLRWRGRVWWCACGGYSPISWTVQSQHNSQHLLDAYSLSHVLHGVLFFGLFWMIARRWALGWRLVAATAIEVAWELVENSPIVINRYR